MNQPEHYPLFVETDTYVAQHLPSDTTWMEGAINSSPEPSVEVGQVVAAALESIQPVEDTERAYASCTDGRYRVDEARDAHPVRRQLVGSSAVAAFRIAESLGEKFYRTQAMTEAPTARRIAYVGQHLQANGLALSTHTDCGAAKGFIAVQANEIRFNEHDSYKQQLPGLLPEGLYDDQLRQSIIDDTKMRLSGGRYSDYTANLFLHDARLYGGVIEHYKGDDRGVNGHVERLRLLLDETVDGALSPNELYRQTSGAQVFAVNAVAERQVATVIAENVKGSPQESAYIVGRHVLAIAGSAGHGTLGSNLQTYVVSQKTA